jgi:hypothetical protein
MECSIFTAQLLVRMTEMSKFVSETPPLYDKKLVAGYEGVELDPNDPFECVLRKIVLTNRKKREDYAQDGNPFSNFEDTAWITASGLPEWSALFNVAQKLSRLKSLCSNGRLNDPRNESVADTYLDLAVYAVIAHAIYVQRTDPTYPASVKDNG